MQLIPGIIPLDQAQIDHAQGILRALGPPGAAIAAVSYDQLPEGERALVGRYVTELVLRMRASGAPEDALVDVLLVAVRFDRSSTDDWNRQVFSTVLVPALHGFAACGMWWAVQRLCRLIGFIYFHSARDEDDIQAMLDAMEDAVAEELTRWRTPELHPTAAPDSLTIGIVSDYRLADLSGVHVLMRFLEAYRRRFAGRDRIHLVIERSAITEASALFRARLEAAGVTIVTYDQSANDPLTPIGFGNLSSVCAGLRLDVAVFLCSYCFALLAAWCRVAPIQAFWSLSFDAAPSRQFELLLSSCSTQDGSGVKTVGARRWSVAPPAYIVTPHPVAPVRRDGPYGALGRPLFGSVGDIYKFGNAAFMTMLARLLEEFPEAAFLGTAAMDGRSIDIARGYGIAERCHNVGFVDVDSFAPQIDVHLDTFPYGTAVASLRMLGCGCPTVGMRTKHSLDSYIYGPMIHDGFGDPERHARARALFFPPGERPRLLVANTVDEYVGLAAAVARDPDYRAACADAYRRLFCDVLADGAYSVEAWRRTLVAALDG